MKKTKRNPLALQGTIIDVVLPETKSVSLQSLKRKWAPNKRKVCWGCTHYFGKPTKLGEYPERDRIWAEYVRLREYLDVENVAELISQYHEEHILQYEIRHKRKDAMYWPPEMVLEHITDHFFDPVIRLRADIDELDLIKRTITESMVDGGQDSGAEGLLGEALSTQPKVNPMLLKDYLQVNKQKLELEKELASLRH